MILEQALEHPPREREHFVQRECQGNAEVRCEVESLLAEADAGTRGFLESPAELPPPPQLPVFDWIGRAVGAHRVVRRIGSGGMGTVYLAERPGNAGPAPVAVKVMREDLCAAALQHRFEQEHALHAPLAHPGIARLLGRGVCEGRPYLVLEHVEGLPIDAHCRQRALNIEQRIALFIEVCMAVQHVHDRQVVHRDIKPANLIVTGAGRPKLLDFGIAELLQRGAPVMAEREGLALFTPESAAPEQLRCEPLTKATDVYGLGLLLYRLLTGQAPHMAYRCGLTLVRLQSVCHDDPVRASDLVGRADADPEPGLPSADVLRHLLRGRLDEILARALANAPAERHPGAAALAADLRDHLQCLQRARRDSNPIRLADPLASDALRARRFRSGAFGKSGGSIRERRSGRSRLPSDRT